MTSTDDGLVLRAIDGFDDRRESWTELAERSGNLFSTWEWAATWWQHFGAGRELRLTGVHRPDGTLLAILPLYEWRRGPLRLMRFVGHGPADQLGPVCDPKDRVAVARAMRAGLDAGYWHCDGLLAEVLAGDMVWEPPLGGSSLAREGSPVCTLDIPDWDAFLARLSSNRRRQIRRDERRLRKSFHVDIRLQLDPAGLGQDMEVFFALHDARWEGLSAAAGDPVRRFQRDFAAVALDRGWLRLWLLELDGRPASAWYGFRFAGAELYYQQGRDPSYDREGVGGVLQTHTMRSAVKDGASEYRFLRGDEPFKYQFADGDPGLDTVVCPSSALGRAAVGSVRVMRRSARGRRLVVRSAR